MINKFFVFTVHMLRNITIDIIHMRMLRAMMDQFQHLVLLDDMHHVKELMLLIKELHKMTQDTQIVLPSKKIFFLYLLLLLIFSIINFCINMKLIKLRKTTN